MSPAQLPLTEMQAPKRVLVIDDEPAIQFAYKRLIERQGLAVDICDSLAAALALTDRHPYDVVIADLRLAGSDNSDGLKILATFKIKYGTQVIMITGNGRREGRRAALALGASFFFEKPVLPSAILEAVNACLDYRD